ncbi:MAG: carboxypeptidase regulatory-like domain-containing protein [Chitinophagaceae bacterium]|nr:carboxypeptidase regulatory-like domain-containing protein [Chitinophagaceae bacterium]
MKKIIFYSMMLLVIMVNSCQKNDLYEPPTGGDTTHLPELPKEGVPVKTSVFGRIVDEQDAPLQGVTVSGGGSAATTDMNGIFILKDIMLDQARAYITATKTGYFSGSRIFQPVKDGMSKPPLIKMLAQKSIGSINAASGGVAESKGGIKVELPANAIEGYSGQVNVVSSYINPTSPDFFARMPGDLAADNAENKRGALISYGMAAIDLLDGAGKKLKLKSGMQATITLPVPQSLQKSAATTIAMWHFDETKGIWKEEGSGSYADGKYTGKVSHFSMWNYDHWNPTMILPMIFRWILPKLSSVSTDDDVNRLVNNPPTFLLSVKDKTTKTTLYSNTIPPPVRDNNSEPKSASTDVTFPLPQVSDVMEVTVTPVQPGGPDYPTNTDHSPTADEVKPAPPTIATEGESVTVEVKPTNPPSKITITLPPQSGGGGGNGETVVNVNGIAVDCDNKPITTGYAFMSMRSGNTIVKSTTAPVYGNEGRFTAQYVFYTALQNKIDNVVLTIYDVTTGKRSPDMKINVNPSVAYMLQEPVKVCDANNGGGNNGNSKVFKGNYVIENAATLQAFIDSAYTEVTGILYVSNMSDLGGIIKLKKVGGIELRRNTITSLGGLAELEDMSSLTLVENGQLVNAAFPKLANKNLQGINISYSLSLVGLTLPSVENIGASGGSINITGNPVLKTLSIPNLKSVDKCGYMVISNSLLENLNTFANASGTLGTWGLTLTDNSALTSVSGLSKIVCTARLTIDQCVKLPTLQGINIPADMADWVSITKNDVLTDITAVSDKLKSTGTQGGLTITSNAALKTASFPLYEKGNVVCKENGALATLSMPKFKEAGSVDITHNIKLATIDMKVLESLPNGFYMSGGYETTQALTTFDLPALKTCGQFVIINCPGITNLDGFANLETVNGDLTITNAQIPGASIKLKTINGFNKLTSLPFSLNLEQAASAGDGLVGYDGPLAGIKGFKNLKTIGGMFNIGGKNLTDISGFANLESVGQDTRIITTGLAGLEGLAKLKSAGLKENRLIYIQTNTKLTSIKGLAALTDISGIYFTRNPELKDLQGLEKIKSMKYGITISVNDKLTNIDGLANVEGAINGITISENKVLSSLCGITKLIKGGGNTGVYRVSSNAYNPTVDDIKSGKCSK